MPLLTEEALNDFFLPSQDCIKPVEINRTNLDSEIKIDNGIHWEVSKDGTETQLEAASITLNDCLACSGCVTTAESVLIGLQSWSEVESTIKAAEKRIMVASICPQSIASVATSYNLSIDTTFSKLRTLLSGLGFAQVVSTNIGREIALHESADEFIVHHKSVGSKSPLLASACPGWICYAEKQKSSLIPIISKIRSPQQLTGVMLKDVVSRTHKISRDEIYHVAIMPCFDKKLEASRAEFQVDGARDVDTVITSAEIVQMMRDSSIDFPSLQPANDDPSDSGDDTHQISSPSTGVPPYVARHPGSSSGGFLTHILIHAARTLFNISLPASLDSPHIRISVQKSPKLKEYELLAADGTTTLLRFAEAYGFRQITSLTQKLSPKGPLRRAAAQKRVQYDYVEVMACESGCINGGGQVRPPLPTTPTPSAPATLSDMNGTLSNADWMKRVEAAYNSEAAVLANANQYREIIKWWTGQDQEVPDETVKAKMATTYNEIPPLVNPLASKW